MSYPEGYAFLAAVICWCGFGAIHVNLPETPFSFLRAGKIIIVDYQPLIK